MKHITPFAIMMGLAACDAGDQTSERDRAMREMAEAMAATSSSVIVAPAATRSQRALLLENLVEQKTAYQVLSASPEELGLLQQVRGLIHTVTNDQSLGSEELGRIMKRTSDLKSVGAEPIGLLPDAGRRQSVLFKLPTGKLGMLAVWDYKADDGKMFVFQEALTFEVAGRKAALSLSQNPNDDRRLWTLAWATDAEDYTLYLEDSKTKTSDTYWNPVSIRELAEQMTR